MTPDPARDRYSRQVRFAGVGEAGQERLGRSTALVVGVGALGSHAADTLVRAGVGRLVLVDRDVVELHNLQRQVLYTEADARAGAPKALAAAAHLRRVNSSATVVGLAEEFTAATLAAVDPPPDVILDGTDNFATRYLINDLAAARRIPWIYAGAVAAEALAMVVLPGETPCLRCILPEAAANDALGTCETDGILSPAVAAVVAFQTAEAIKILVGRRDAVARGVLAVDVWRNHWQLQLQGARVDDRCPCCGRGEYPALAAAAPPAVSLCGRNAVQVRPAAAASLDLDRLAARLRGSVDGLEHTPHLLRFSADGCRFSVFPGGRALLFGVADANRALALYDRWIGARR